MEISTGDGEWKIVADYTEKGISGSPVVIPVDEKAEKVKISFSQKNDTVPAIWELHFYHQ